ncbi:hypothetical protein [Halorubellus sp. PRR65]|uniref:hypothetical protein n=1 Tax=Halorubellus sp. PRR65 TaxID=3098148 RepID=UPI002B262FD4|nr:hypothetical protein [Halorubellus sp. PRR65]
MADKDDPTPTVSHTDVQKNSADSEPKEVDITHTHDSSPDEDGTVESSGQDSDV